jgi:hypothetical protein
MLESNFSAEYNTGEGYGKIAVTKVITDTRKILELEAEITGNLDVIFHELNAEGDSKREIIINGESRINA